MNIKGLDLVHREPGFVLTHLPNGDRLEVFGEDSLYDTFFNAPVAGFPGEDITSASLVFVGYMVPAAVLWFMVFKPY